MNKKILLLLCLLTCVINAQKIDTSKNIEKIRSEITHYNNERYQKVNSFLNKNPQFKKRIINGDIIYIAYDVIDGNLIYMSNFNTDAALATRTNFLKEGSSLGLDLKGSGMNIGLWEVGGSPLTTHVEFNNTGTSRIIISDGASNEIIYHATHVAGTLGASGINANAKGMASEATILSFDAINDNNEALSQATNNNLLISNHSYGIPISGENGTAPISLMGTYNASARIWDLIAVESPYYLSVFSAGNDGNSSYNGGTLNGYDKLTGEKNSKNNLVVANASNIFINNSGNGDFITAIINSSSSQGPSDDGRIKPDITGLGTNIFSTSNNGNNAYGTATGTSMSAPNVSGSLLLLQELYFDLHGEYMKSSTLKGISLITADDAGNIGPDAIFGWGILNSKKAAETIISEFDSQNALINETTINNNSQISFSVSSNGIDPLKVGVFWTDPAGFAQTGTINSTIPALVNDIDIKLIDENGNEHFPWRLNLDNFAGSAQKGINSVDNVEVVEIGFPTSTTYTVEISHKGSLINNFQDISIIATGIDSHNLSVTDNEIVGLKIWPNPVNETLFINIDDLNLKTKFVIYNLNGKIIKKGDLSDNNNIDLSNILKGIYIMHISNSSGLETHKIIKN